MICQCNDPLLIEFGSISQYIGHLGSSPLPKGKELGYTRGAYGKGLGNNYFCFYYAVSGEAVMSHGTQATMPVYKAGIEMRRQVLKIAREVFGE